MSNGYLKDDNGNSSTGRVAIWFGFINGTIVNIFGCIGFVMKQPDAAIVIGAGCGLIASTVMMILKIDDNFIKYANIITALVMLVTYLMASSIKFSDVVKFRILRSFTGIAVIGIILVLGTYMWGLPVLLLFFLVYILTGLYGEVKKKFIIN